MNIRLIPYHWTRHFSVGLFIAGVATISWWLVINLFVFVFPRVAPAERGDPSIVLDQFYEGVFLMVVLSISVGVPAIFAEGILRHQAPLWVAAKMLVAGLLGGLLTGAGVFLFDFALFKVGKTFGDEILGGSATAGLRYKIMAWIICGVATGFAVYAARMGWFLVLKLRERFEEKIPKFIKLPHEYVVVPSAFNHLVGGGI